jgi:hypothetical protein
MKNKFSIFNLKLVYYLKQLITNEYPDSKSEVKKNKVVIENDLRWEDDGGPAVEIAEPSQMVENQSPQTTDIDGNDFL